MNSARFPTTVLIIDDNEKERTYYAERIRIGLPDCHVLEAKDRSSGLKLYTSHRVDCIITKLHLSEIYGFWSLVVPLASEPEIREPSWKALADIAVSNGAKAFLCKRLTV